MTLAVAAVHGRFQPLHLDHMEYILRALDRANYLHIGIAQFERGRLVSVPGAGAHRQSAAANPLSYFERARLLDIALIGADISTDRYSIGPFPLERPHDLTEYLPNNIPILTTQVEEWNDHKIALLRAQGYVVDVLYERDPKGVSGAEIRRLIAMGEDAWATMVPASTVAYLKSLNLQQRMMELA